MGAVSGVASKSLNIPKLPVVLENFGSAILGEEVCCAVLCCAVLRCAVLCCAVVRCAVVW